MGYAIGYSNNSTLCMYTLKATLAYGLNKKRTALHPIPFPVPVRLVDEGFLPNSIGGRHKRAAGIYTRRRRSATAAQTHNCCLQHQLHMSSGVFFVFYPVLTNPQFLLKKYNRWLKYNNTKSCHLCGVKKWSSHQNVDSTMQAQCIDYASGSSLNTALYEDFLH